MCNERFLIDMRFSKWTPFTASERVRIHWDDISEYLFMNRLRSSRYDMVKRYTDTILEDEYQEKYER